MSLRGIGVEWQSFGTSAEPPIVSADALARVEGMNTPPGAISHLIDAVNALGLALRDLAAQPTAAVRQDGIEHLSEVELLTELLSRRLSQ